MNGDTRIVINSPPSRPAITAYRSRISFDPSEIRPGDRIGWYTITSNVRIRFDRQHGHPCWCTWGDPPYNPATGRCEYPPQCSRVDTVYLAMAVCRCNRREEIKLTGDRWQRTGCYLCTRANSYNWPLPGRIMRQPDTVCT